MDVLEGMNADGLTLIVVTHDPAVARQTGRILIMRDGCIVHKHMVGTPFEEDLPTGKPARFPGADPEHQKQAGSSLPGEKEHRDPGGGRLMD